MPGLHPSPLFREDLPQPGRQPRQAARGPHSLSHPDHRQAGLPAHPRIRSPLPAHALEAPYSVLPSRRARHRTRRIPHLSPPGSADSALLRTQDPLQEARVLPRAMCARGPVHSAPPSPRSARRSMFPAPPSRPRIPADPRRSRTP